MQDLIDAIDGADKLTHVFGMWPSFHDAEVLSVILDRAGADGPSLTAQIYVFAMTPEVDATGHYVLRNRTVVTIRFTQVALSELRWFNHQNVLFELAITPIDPTHHEDRRFKVEASSSYGMEASFECGSIIVVEVEPYETSK